jgi:hypothetical protein
MHQHGLSPTHHLRNFFGPKATFHSFTLVKSSGLCIAVLPPFLCI